ncbi:hypothetical protein [Alistipes sp.]|uniref:hypothetical protein n=1 Tax=Alistipes sp. TaxID=1872444 RepID=UPI003AF14085
MKQIDRDALKEWEELKESIYNDTPIDESMSPAEIEKHRLYLEAHPVEWMQFFFPKYAKASFAPFHIKAIQRLIRNPEWFEVLSWSRELAKSTLVMFVVLYLILTGRKSTVILAAATQKAATRLLAPYRANLEANRRIKQYYGEQMSVGEWAELEFKTEQGAMFLGVGAGDAPRGARNEAVRPDILLLDDFDTDEECMNPDVLDKKWDWWEHALYPTRSISEPTLIIFCGNIIAEDCCIVRAGKFADHWDIVNIRDRNGRSTWPEKNTEEHIDRALAKVSTKAQQGEYFNNPIVEGKTFGPRKWGKIPWRKFPFLCIYADPTQSEAKGTAKNKKGSLKAVWLLGKSERTLYVIKGFLGKMTTDEYATHFFTLYLYARMRTQVPIFVVQENNSLQDPFFQQVFRPAFARKSREMGINLSVLPDEKKKTDKAVRIEANLEPLHREGLLVLNEDERDDPQMKALDEEFKFFTLALKFHADGVDCVEGGNRFIDDKMGELQPPVTIPRRVMARRNKFRQ